MYIRATSSVQMQHLLKCIICSNATSVQMHRLFKCICDRRVATLWTRDWTIVFLWHCVACPLQDCSPTPVSLQHLRETPLCTIRRNTKPMSLASRVVSDASTTFKSYLADCNMNLTDGIGDISKSLLTVIIYIALRSL